MLTIYIDELICRLQKSGIGCFIAQEYYGCLSYAGDFVLLCPSVKGLQRIVDLCAEFKLEFSVTYYAKKKMYEVWAKASYAWDILHQTQR